MVCGKSLQGRILPHTTTPTYLPIWMHTAIDIQEKTPEKSTLHLLHQPTHCTTGIITNTPNHDINNSSEWYTQQKHSNTLRVNKLRLTTAMISIMAMLGPVTFQSPMPTIGTHYIPTTMPNPTNSPVEMNISAPNLAKDTNNHASESLDNATSIPHTLIPNMKSLAHSQWTHINTSYPQYTETLPESSPDQLQPPTPSTQPDTYAMQHRFEQEFVQQQQEIEKNRIRLDKHLKNLEVYVHRYQQSLHQTQFQPVACHLAAGDARYLQAVIHQYFFTVHCTATPPATLWHYHTQRQHLPNTTLLPMNLHLYTSMMEALHSRARSTLLQNFPSILPPQFLLAAPTLLAYSASFRKNTTYLMMALPLTAPMTSYCPRGHHQFVFSAV